MMASAGEMVALEYIFWLSGFLIVYPYLVYPLILRLGGAFRSDRATAQQEAGWPTVTMVVSAYNEERVIGEKLRNCTALDYPDERLQIIVVSDASTDRTDAIVGEWSRKHGQIELLRQEARRGKTAGLNPAVRGAQGEIIIFSDANAIYEPAALKELVKPFADEGTGYVVGSALYNADGRSEASESESLYWRFELHLKRLESRFGSVVGGDGAIYAIRRHLWEHLDDDDINDFANPLQIVAAGYHGVFNPRAICYEDAAAGFDKEFRRKRRIVNRSWRAVKKNFSRFSLSRHAPFLFELFSHKILRWFAIVPLVVMVISSFVLALLGSLLYALALAGFIAILAAAVYGRNLDRRGQAIPRPIYLPYYFLLVNWAALLGLLDEWRGERYETWEHVRDSQ